MRVIPLPFPCPNEEYERLMAAAVAEAKADGITHMGFGDLFLEDVRQYRIGHLRDTGIEPLFPIWSSEARTPALAREMIDAGVRAMITCVDTEQLDARFLGREFDARLLDDLPASVDPCGERGEFHTFCYAGPMFDRPLTFRRGEAVDRERFRFMDAIPVAGVEGSETLRD